MAHELLAKSDHQLGMCRRMLYAEGIRSSIPVHSAKNEKGKMEFLVTVPVTMHSLRCWNGAIRP